MVTELGLIRRLGDVLSPSSLSCAARRLRQDPALWQALHEEAFLEASIRMAGGKLDRFRPAPLGLLKAGEMEAVRFALEPDHARADKSLSDDLQARARAAGENVAQAMPGEISLLALAALSIATSPQPEEQLRRQGEAPPRLLIYLLGLLYDGPAICSVLTSRLPAQAESVVRAILANDGGEPGGSALESWLPLLAPELTLSLLDTAHAVGERDLERRIAAALPARNPAYGLSFSSAPEENVARGDLDSLIATRVSRALGTEEEYRRNLELLLEGARRRTAAFISELANQALERDDPVTALAAFQDLQDLQPASCEARTGMARAFLRLNRIEDALQQVPASPEAPEDWFALALIHGAQGHASLACQCALRASPVERNALSSRLLMDTARMLASQGACREASEIQGSVVERTPCDSQALLDLASYQASCGNWESARDNALLSWTLDPSRDTALQLLAEGHERLGNFPEAQSCWHRLLEDRPGDSEALLHLAQTSLQVGDSGQAEEAARKLSAARPDSGEAHALLGAALLAKGDLSAARAALQASTQLSPSSSLAWKALAELYEKGGELESAAAALRTGVESTSQPVELLIGLGTLALRRGLPTEAAAALQRALALAPRDPAILQPFAEALIRLGRSAEAEQALRTALQVSPARTDTILALADLLESEGRLAEGRAALEGGLQVEPACKALRLRLARSLVSLYHQGGDNDPSLLQQAIALLEPALRQCDGPTDRSYLILLGRAQLLNGKPTEALATFTRAVPDESVPSDPSAREAHLGAAQALLQMKEPDSALSHARLAVQIAPDDPSSLQMLARASEAAGSLEEAREAYHRWLVLAPDQAQALHGLGLVERQAGQIGQAIQLLQQAMELTPNHPSGWADLAETLAADQQMDTARQAMAKALATAAGKDRQITLRAAQFFLDAKEYAEAARILRDSLAKDPSDVGALEALGLAALRSNQIEEAIEAYAKAVELDPGNPEVLAHAAEAYWQDGRRGAAIALWKKAVGLGPSGQAFAPRLADALQRTGDFGEAVRFYEGAIEANSSNPQILTSGAQAALHSHDLAKAHSWVRQALQADPANIEARKVQAQIALETGETDEALRVASQLVIEVPEDGLSWALLAKCHAALGAPAEAAGGALEHPALRALQNAVAKCLSSPEAMFVTAEAALQVEDYASAIRLLDTLSCDHPEEKDFLLRLAEALTARAEAFFRWHAARDADSSEWMEAVSPASEQAARSALKQARALGVPAEMLSSLETRISLAFAHPDSEAVEGLQHLASQTPSTPALVSLAQAHLRLGDASQAERWAAKAVEADPRNAAASIALALAHWKQGHTTEALQRLGLASELASFLALPHALTALVQASVGNMDQATGSLQKAVALAPQAPSWEHLLGQWLAARGDLEASIAHYQRASELSPGTSDYQISLARALRRDGDLSGAHAHYHQALRHSQEAPPQLWAEAGELALEAGNPQEAVQDLRKALAASSQTPPVEWGLCLARALTATGHRSEARKLVETVSSDKRYEGQSLSILAEIEESQGNLDQAAELLGRAVPLLPDPLLETLHLARLWILSGKPERAVEVLAAIEPAHPNSDLLSHSLAEALLKLGKGEEALQRAQAATQLAPRRGEHWLLVGRVARKLGQIDQALDAIRRARELDPKDWHADLELGLCLEVQQRWDLALEAYRAAARLNATNSEVMYRMGVVLKNLRSYAEAADALRKAVQLNPNNLPAHRLLSAVMALGLVYGLPQLATDKR